MPVEDDKPGTIKFRRPVGYRVGDPHNTAEDVMPLGDESATLGENFTKRLAPEWGEINDRTLSFATGELLKAAEPMIIMQSFGSPREPLSWWERKWFWFTDHVVMAFVFFWKILKNGANEEVYYR